MCSRKKPGPGPGKYAQPNLTGYIKHDPTRYRNPAYSIQNKRTIGGAGVGGPGPAAYTTAGLTEHGKLSVPAYSLVNRPKPMGGPRSPGPATYDPTKFRAGPNPPSCIITCKPKGIGGQRTPGPNAYNPNFVGKSVPAYSMTFKSTMSGQARSPGPGQYNPVDVCVYKHCPPKCIVTQRIRGPALAANSPGPAAYSPKYTFKQCITGTSIGRRTCVEPYILPEDEYPCINK